MLGRLFETLQDKRLPAQSQIDPFKPVNNEEDLYIDTATETITVSKDHYIISDYSQRVFARLPSQSLPDDTAPIRVHLPVEREVAVNNRGEKTEAHSYTPKQVERWSEISNRSSNPNEHVDLTVPYVEIWYQTDR